VKSTEASDGVVVEHLGLAESHCECYSANSFVIRCSRLFLTVSGVGAGKITLGQLLKHVRSGLRVSSAGDSLGDVCLGEGDIMSVYFGYVRLRIFDDSGKGEVPSQV
jgi:hypothetical protein